jgi:hypothetical protein
VVRFATLALFAVCLGAERRSWLPNMGQRSEKALDGVLEDIDVGEIKAFCLFLGVVPSTGVASGLCTARIEWLTPGSGAVEQ